MQQIFAGAGRYEAFRRYLFTHGAHHIFLVCGASFDRMTVRQELAVLREGGVTFTRFSAFEPNPRYASVVAGVQQFRASGADALLAVGGGSAMDVAKCIKLYSNMNPARNYLEQPMVPNALPFAVVPTTAGTGSEATRYAVIYYKGEKQSVTDASCIPDAVLFDPVAVAGLPLVQKKATLLDACAHAIESFWSVNSTEKSRKLSAEALRLLQKHGAGYLANQLVDVAGMQQAAYVAGQAINITQTTAGHAMCYKLTSRYGLPHGQAAALCVAVLWPYMLEHVEDAADARGAAYLHEMFQALAQAMGERDAATAAASFAAYVQELGMAFPRGTAQAADVLELAQSVNPVRLKNHPIRLTGTGIASLYRTLLHL
ncbi:phosphonoacetaldehyde reductase [Selenomonas sp.]|uniref:phosphonoacetaldehyde reductase n=1 Tax=Selenomonas sp. TaxID=2053611 RepID=UPI0025CFE821|nr:phosphonoacetaldehyde reductase [Selenomonas sp.]MCI6085829.1 phosphonoacetaldehyde reductase [Selenomonas sp.]MDY3298701.1 phosphonoacetaldehyde reductase [Selenomonas sp.]MDY4416755.1 phosphonoacetaldehyde reductase [Selenomonas sp.]